MKLQIYIKVAIQLWTFGNWRKGMRLWIITLQFQIKKQIKKKKQINKQT